MATAPSRAEVHSPETLGGHLADGTITRRNSDIILHRSSGDPGGSRKYHVVMEVLPSMKPMHHALSEEAVMIHQTRDKSWRLSTTTNFEQKWQLSGQTLQFVQYFDIPPDAESVSIKNRYLEYWRLFCRIVGPQVAHTFRAFDAGGTEVPRPETARTNDENIHAHCAQAENLAEANAALTEELSSLRGTISVLTESLYHQKVDNLAPYWKDRETSRTTPETSRRSSSGSLSITIICSAVRANSPWRPCSVGCVSANGERFQNEIQQLWIKVEEFESIARQTQKATSQLQREQASMVEALDARINDLRVAQADTKNWVSDLGFDVDEQQMQIRRSHVRCERELARVEQDHESLTAKIAAGIKTCKMSKIQQAREFDAQIVALQNQCEQDHRRLLTEIVSALPRDGLLQNPKSPEIPDLQRSVGTFPTTFFCGAPTHFSFNQASPSFHRSGVRTKRTAQVKALESGRRQQVISWH